MDKNNRANLSPIDLNDDTDDEVIEERQRLKTNGSAHNDENGTNIQSVDFNNAEQNLRQEYTPGRGFSRYRNTLNNLVPIRRGQKSTGTMPIDNVGFLSFVTFSWLSKYMYRAYKKNLTIGELPSVSPYDTCDYNVRRLEILWEDELARRGPEKASFGKVAWRFMRTRFLASTFIFGCSVICGFISPTILMRKLLEYVESPEDSYGKGVKWAILLTLSELLRMLFFAWNWALNYRTALRLKSACLNMLYRKIIRLNHLGNTSSGKLINMFANDGQRIFDMILFGPMVIGGPIIAVLSVGYIWWLLGPMALLGMTVFMMFYPTQYGISRLVGYLRSKTVTISDARVRLTNEILDCMKLIKMYAWEKRFSDDLIDIRNKEQNYLLKTTYCQSLSIALSPTVPVISAIITFLAHLSTGQNLTAAMAFPITSFFGNQMKQALTRIRDASQSIVDSSIAFGRLKVFPFISLLNTQFRSAINTLQIGLDNIITSLISFNRIKTILLLDDGCCPVSKPIVKSQAIAINHGTFAYDSLDNHVEEIPDKNQRRSKKIRSSSGERSEKTKLKAVPKVGKIDVLFDITFEAAKGKLIGICGHVGSGKSSLLLAALGQLRIIDGQVMRDGSCAYVSQQAWIVNATLKENILFGERFDAKRYYRAMRVCNLTYDLEMLPGGDQTEIGERGINLSGGQKQRIALARALYADRDIYFLDDPLSAVDAHVGLHIFDNLIQGALHNKTVLFVTHQVQYLNRCDDIFMMHDGRIVEHGTHDELMKMDQEYASMVNSISSDNIDTKKTVTVRQKSHSQSKENVSSGGVNLSRSVSDSSRASADNTDKLMDPKATLTIAEKCEQGIVKAHTYLSYVRAAGGYFVALVVLTTTLVNVGSTAFSSWWLAQWLKAGGGNVTDPETGVTIMSDNIKHNPKFDEYQTIYAASIGIILGTNLLRSFVFGKSTMRASTNLHNTLFRKIMSSPMRFFDTTPTGRIQNLFSRDMDEIDNRLPTTIDSIMQNIILVFFAIFFICLVFPWFILPLCFLTLIYYCIIKVFSVAVRDLKRMENSSRSPIFSFITATVHGLGTIHAFEKDENFRKNFTKLFDDNNSCVFLCCYAMRWLAVRIDSLSVMITCITGLLVVFLKGQVPPALAGLALAYSAQIAGIFQYTVRLVSETEMRFISVERMNTYINESETDGCNGKVLVKVNTAWPAAAKIKFHKVCMSYGPDMPLVLNGVSVTIEPREKIGIVGRTGSGKSSLTVALFRLVELVAGKIVIDDVDISEVGLEELRSRLSIIPQDPVLFSGTIRSNLDPFKKNSDSEIWEVLDKTKLKDRVRSINGQLDASVGFGGDNLSVGERQLLCLARALLRHAKILVLDEATAAVDPETEIAVQNTIQREFVDSTVLTIAHRLQTVVSCDRILVMDDGRVAEFDTPSTLLANERSQFFKMMEAAEKATKQRE